MSGVSVPPPAARRNRGGRRCDGGGTPPPRLWFPRGCPSAGPAPLRWRARAPGRGDSPHTSVPSRQRHGEPGESERGLTGSPRDVPARHALGVHSRREVAPVDSDERTFPRCSSSRWGAPSPYRTLGPRSRGGCARAWGGKTIGLPSVCYLKYDRKGTSTRGMTPAPNGPMFCYKWDWEPAQNEVGMTAVPLPKITFHFI